MVLRRTEEFLLTGSKFIKVLVDGIYRTVFA